MSRHSIKLNFSTFILSFAFLNYAACLRSDAQTGDSNYVQTDGTVVKANQAYSASSGNTSGILVSNGGTFTLANSTVTTTGNSSSTDSSSQYGLSAGVWAKSASVIALTELQ